MPSVIDLQPDPDRAGAWMLRLNGIPQSYVDLADPAHIRFESMRYMRFAIDGLLLGTPECLHIGGGALTLGRYIAHAHPGSKHLVLEPDAEMVELVRARIGLESAVPDLRVQVRDGRTGVAACGGGTFDLAVLDAYAGKVIPAELTTVEFARDVARVLRGNGSLIANLVDQPSLGFVRRMLATVREALPHMLLISDEAVLGRRVLGHLTLVASAAPERIAGVAKHLAVQGVPRLAWLHGAELEALRGQAQPLRDADIR